MTSTAPGIEGVPSSIGASQVAYVALRASVFLWALLASAKVKGADARRGGFILVFAIALLFAVELTKLALVAMTDGWPYAMEYSFVTSAALMSLQLGMEYRRTDQGLKDAIARAEQRGTELADALEHSLGLRDKLNTPLQTLQIALALHNSRSESEAAHLREMQRAVDQLTELGRTVERVSTPEGTEESRRVTISP